MYSGSTRPSRVPYGAGEPGPSGDGADALRELAAQAPCGLFALDHRLRFLSANDTLLDWLGCRREEVVGRLGPADFMAVAARERFEAMLPILRGLGTIGHLSVVVTGRQGRARTLELGARSQFDADGRIVRTHWMALDRSAAAPSAVDAVAGDDADRVRREVLSSLSHALRTPLHQATGLVHLLDRARAEADETRFATFLGFLDTSCRELRRRINALLDHANGCTSPPNPLVCDLRAVLSPLLATLRPVALRRRIALGFDCPSALVLQVDPERLRQAVGALLDNALAFTHEGGRVSVRAAGVEGVGVRIEVEDDGIGIAADDLARLFVEFARLPAGEARHPDGLGLGLARCRRLVHAMGGRVDASSRPEHGSVFTILLPHQTGPGIAPGSTQRS